MYSHIAPPDASDLVPLTRKTYSGPLEVGQDYKWKDSTLRWFSTLTTLGTPLDVALQELRIETLFPADEATRTLMNRLAEPVL